MDVLILVFINFVKCIMYKSFIHYIAFPLTGVAENSVSNNWVICCTTLEIREEIGNQFSVDLKHTPFVRIDVFLVEVVSFVQ